MCVRVRVRAHMCVCLSVSVGACIGVSVQASCVRMYELIHVCPSTCLL